MALTFNQLRKLMPVYLNTGKTIHLKSSPGRGKSTFVKDLCKDMERRTGEPFGLSILFLANCCPTDISGAQYKGQMEYNGKNITISDPALPQWQITSEGKLTSEYKRGILFLDEYGQGDADTKRMSAELKLNKQIDRWVLGGENRDGWSVICASNYTTDRSGVQKDFDHCINRETQIEIQDDLDSLLEWMDENNVTEITKHFTRENPHIVFTAGVPDKQGPWCTPRSAVENDEILREFSEDGGETIPDTPEMIELSAGRIGAPAAQAFFTSVKLAREMPPYSEIVANPTKAKLPEKIDAQYLIAHKLAARVSADDIEPVVRYASRMPKELQVTLARAACVRNRKLVMTPAMIKWSKDNASLMAAINL